jgi:hypothetical protein
MVGQAAVARRLGDLARARALLDAAASHYQHVDLPIGPPRVRAGLAWWALAAGHLADTAVFTADAANGAFASGDPTTQLPADTAVAAVKATADPTGANTCAFTALSRRRAQGAAYRSLTDEPDVAALTAPGAAPSLSGPLGTTGLSITSAPPQRTRATLQSCSRCVTRTPATITTWPLPGLRWTSTAAR